MHGAEGADFEGLNAVLHVIHWTRGAGEVKNVIYFSAVEGLVDIELAKLEAGVVAQVVEVGGASGEQIVGDDDRVAFGQQRITKMRAEEAGSSGDQGA